MRHLIIALLLSGWLDFRFIWEVGAATHVFVPLDNACTRAAETVGELWACPAVCIATDGDDWRAVPCTEPVGDVLVFEDR